ncbi:hypothetical protein CDAR_475811 [Caerostris darwini]|uniref:Uncharacterized protein n=1 Tax=Caerostris darwini TaxID=1538125 RepID=A0AAV4PE88_9ARAC|nr:hypothetical protein CDAR_475811 [Caerostris darwini]
MNPRFSFFISEDGESDVEKSGSRHHPVSMPTAAQEFSPYMVCWRQTMRLVMGWRSIVVRVHIQFVKILELKKRLLNVVKKNQIRF